MRTVETNDKIKIAFTGKLDNGDVFMTVTKDNPMTVTIGESELPPSVENGLIGLAAGQARAIKVSSEEGYGPRQKDLLQTISNKEFIEKINPKPGMIISLKVNRDGSDHQVPATVMEVRENEVVIDYNHPLAGHNLTYEIEILQIL